MPAIATFHVNDPLDPLVALGADAVEQQLLQVDGEDDPTGGNQVGRQFLDFGAQLEFVFRRYCRMAKR